MPKPVTIPNTFATATTASSLANLDADFAAVASTVNDANSYSNYAADTGSANAYVVTLAGITTTYTAGLRIQFTALNANTTASTVNVNGQGAKNITFQDTTALSAGTIAANSIVDIIYDGTQFLLMNNLGYLNIPQNSQSANYTLVVTDAGKHIFHPSADTTARTFTIPANSSVAFAIGTAISFINQNGAGVITIAITAPDVMRLSPTGLTGNRSLAANGTATCVKITATEWIISGNALS